MLKKRYVVGESVESIPTIKEHRSFYHRLAEIVIYVMLGLFVPRATIYGGLSPFGVSVAACVRGPASLLICISTAIGYILPGAGLTPLRYIAALVAVAGFSWAMGSDNRIVRSSVFSPLLAMGATLATGLALGAMNGLQISFVMMECCEAVLAGGFAYFFKNTIGILESGSGPRSLSFMQQASLTITAAVVLMSINGITFSEISVGRIFTMLIILLAARAGREEAGTLIGVILGSATAFCAPSYAHLAAAYAFGGLIAGLFAKFGKIPTVLTFVIVNALTALSTGQSEPVVIGLYESFASSLLYLILPSSVEKGANALFSRAHELPAVEGMRRSIDMRLTYAANTMRGVAGTVDAVSEKLAAMNAPDLREVYGYVCENICCKCGKRETCWKSDFADTMTAFRKIGQVLRENGRIETDQAQSMFFDACRHVEEIATLMNNGYADYLMRESAFRRLADIRSIVTDQFEGMAELLSETAKDINKRQRVDPETASRIEEICEKYRMPVVETTCLIGKRNRLTAEILIEGNNIPPNNGKWFHDLCNACGCQLDEPTVSKNGFLTRIRIGEKPRYAIHFAAAQLNCREEALCGDAYEQFYDHEGRFCVALSDGMGSGGRAAVDGAMTAALAGRMMQAGFGVKNILRIINSALIVKSNDESLSTLDMLRIDLFSGQVEFQKAGAAPSFLCSGGRVSKISASTLPIGILSDVEAEGHYDVMSAGDCLVMVSDGVVSDDSDWLETMLNRLTKQSLDPQTLAREIVAAARERQGEAHSDDTTALVLQISQKK